MQEYAIAMRRKRNNLLTWSAILAPILSRFRNYCVQSKKPRRVISKRAYAFRMREWGFGAHLHRHQ
jgi:hypothetical protein